MIDFYQIIFEISWEFIKVNFLSLFSNQDIKIGQNGIRLEPLTYFHTKGLQEASQEGDL